MEKEIHIIKAALRRLEDARLNFIGRYRVRPGVMYVGAELYATAFPVHDFPHPCEAIQEMLVIPREDLPAHALVIMKPPEVKRGL